MIAQYPKSSCPQIRLYHWLLVPRIPVAGLKVLWLIHPCKLTILFHDAHGIIERIGGSITHFGTRLGWFSTLLLFLRWCLTLSHMKNLCDTLRRLHEGKMGICNHQLSSWMLTSSFSCALHHQLLRLRGHHHMQSCQCDNKVFILRRSGLATWSDFVVYFI